MAEYTPNYRLIKPGIEDNYNVADFNGNADIIDEQLRLAAETGKTAEELVQELALVSEKLDAAEKLLRTAVTVLAPAGTAVSMAKDDVSVRGTAGADHEVKLVLPEIGEWQLSYEYAGASYQRAVDVEHYGNMVLAAAPVLEAAPWAYIDRISREGLAAEVFDIGDEKTVSIGGVDYAVVLLGYDHDELATPSGGRTRAGMTFQLKHCLADPCQWHSDSSYEGGWVNSELRVNTLSAVREKLPGELLAVLKPVMKITASPLYSYVAQPQRTKDELFLLSEIEVWGTVHESSPYIWLDQRYEYYRLGKTTRKSVNDDLVTWWLRSPRWDSNVGVQCAVREHVMGGSTISPTNKQYVSFAFCV